MGGEDEGAHEHIDDKQSVQRPRERRPGVPELDSPRRSIVRRS